MKRLFTILLTLALAVCTGCMHHTRLSNRAIVQAAGIDFTDGEYVATMQLYGLSDSAPGRAEIVTARGATLTALFADAAVSQGKQLFLGNLRLILLGASLSESGIGDTLQFLNGYHQLSPATQVAVAGGDAAGLLEKAGASAFSGGLLDTLTSAQKIGRAPVCRLMDLIPAEQRDRAAPLLALREAPGESAPPSEGAGESGGSSGDENAASQEAGAPEPGDGAPARETDTGEIVPAGAVIFSGGRAAAVLTPETTRGLCWLQNDLQAAVLETEEPLSAAVTRKAAHHIAPERLADHVVFRIRLDIRSTLLEAPYDTGVYGGIAREQEHLIAEEVESFLTAAYRGGFDPLDLAALLRQHLPSYGENAREALSGAGYDVTVRCEVDRKGAASPNA